MSTDPAIRTSTTGPAVNRTLVGLCIVAAVLGTAARFWPRRDLWLDEALSVNIASLPPADIPGALRRDGHPPLYYFLLHWWMRLGGEGDWWVRALSGVVGAAGIPLMFIAGRRLARRPAGERLGGTRTGLIAMAVFALMPFGVRYGAEARMYALVSTLVLTGYLLVDRLLSPSPARAGGPVPRSGPTAVGVALVAAALLYSHYWSLWLLGVVGLLAIATAVRAVDSDRRRSAVTCASAIVIGGLLYLPWVPSMIEQARNTGTPWGEVFRPATMLVVSLTDFVGGAYAELQATSYALVTAVAVAVFGLIRLRAGRQVVELTAAPQGRVMVELSVLVATIAVGWATSVAGGTTFASRYAAVVFPLFVLAVAGGLAMVRTPGWTTAVVGLSCVALAVGVALEVRSDRTQAGVVADAIAQELATTGGGDTREPALVVACPDQLGVATERALRSRGIPSEVVPYPAADDPRFIDWVDYGDRNRASDPQAFAAAVLDRLGDDQALLVVLSTSYLTFEGKCEEVLGLLATQRPMAQLVTGDAQDFFEPMGLWTGRP